MIVLEVHADLSVPDQVDGLEIALSSPEGSELKTVEVSLDADHDFPLDVGFYPRESTPTVLEGRVTGSLDDARVAEIEVRFNWQPGKLNRVELFPLEPI
jgi:hypothetical protein